MDALDTCAKSDGVSTTSFFPAASENRLGCSGYKVVTYFPVNITGTKRNHLELLTTVDQIICPLYFDIDGSRFHVAHLKRHKSPDFANEFIDINNKIRVTNGFVMGCDAECDNPHGIVNW